MPNPIPNKSLNDHILQLKLTAKSRKGTLTEAQEATLKRVGGLYHKHSPSDEKRTAKRLAAREAKARAEQEAFLAKVADPHASDCATHNEPASPNGPCDCDVEPKA